MKIPHPLNNFSQFSLPPSEPIELPVVSFVMECRPEMMPIIENITKWHRHWFKFQKEIIMSTKDPHIQGTTFIQSPPPPTNERYGFLMWYSDMCIRHLKDLCDAPYMLVWQWDGFVLNPSLWMNDFLKYDYIGGPIYDNYWKEGIIWLQRNKEEFKYRRIDFPTVGNGGFSLRSKKFLEASASVGDLAAYGDDPGFSRSEDFYLCVRKRQELEEKGIKFAPLDLACIFANEIHNKRPLEGCFGYHGKAGLDEVKKCLELRWIK